MKFLLIASTLFFIATQTSAQETSDTLSQQQKTFIKMADSLFYQTDEVIVTGTRGQKKIIDIPYSVARISNVQFKYDKKVSLSDVLNVVPGVFLQNRYGNHDVRISIRGFGSRSNSGIRGVRILLDGIPESEPDGQTRIEAIDFNSIGSIEIVKGNSSSLYTNAPGGVVNFINEINFGRSFLNNFNDFGAYDLRRNGFKLGVRTEKYGLLTTYSYHQYKGYREHSEDYWHILNTVLETYPGDNSNLQFLGYFVSGMIRLPGSLTKEEFEADHLQSAQREKDFDFRRISKKGRVAVRFNSKFGSNLNNEVEITTYGTVKYFERTQRTYRIINRYGLGATARFINRSEINGKENEFSVGGDFLYQSGPIEEYRNIGGKKDDANLGLTDESIGNVGFYFYNNFEVYNKQLYLMYSGRYDNVYFDQKNQLLEIQNDFRRFEAFTPKLALNYKITPSIAFYTSYGLSFDSPAGNELDNPGIEPTTSHKLMNADLLPQKSKNFELGVKGNIINPNQDYLRNVFFEVTIFNSLIYDEIVPFEVNNNVYFRNSARTNRTGVEFGTNLELIRGLKFSLAYTLSEFSYNNYTALTLNALFEPDSADFSGNYVPSIPKHNLNLALSYERTIVQNLTGFSKINYQHVSGMYVDDKNSDKTNGYNILNATLGLDFTIGNFNALLSCGMNNIFEHKYVGFININSTSGRFYEAGEPKNIFTNLKLGYNF